MKLNELEVGKTYKAKDVVGEDYFLVNKKQQHVIFGTTTRVTRLCFQNPIQGYNTVECDMDFVVERSYYEKLDFIHIPRKTFDKLMFLYNQFINSSKIVRDET